MAPIAAPVASQPLQPAQQYMLATLVHGSQMFGKAIAKSLRPGPNGQYARHPWPQSISWASL